MDQISMTMPKEMPATQAKKPQVLAQNVEQQHQQEQKKQEKQQRQLAKKSRRRSCEIKKKPKDMPRRPLSAYNYFFAKERVNVLEERKETKDKMGQEDNNPNSKPDRELFSNMAKTISGRWNSLPSHERERFNEMAAKDMMRYRREMEQYKLKQHDRVIKATIENEKNSAATDQTAYHGRDSFAIEITKRLNALEQQPRQISVGSEGVAGRSAGGHELQFNIDEYKNDTMDLSQIVNGMATRSTPDLRSAAAMFPSTNNAMFRGNNGINDPPSNAQHAHFLNCLQPGAASLYRNPFHAVAAQQQQHHHHHHHHHQQAFQNIMSSVWQPQNRFATHNQAMVYEGQPLNGHRSATGSPQLPSNFSFYSV